MRLPEDQLIELAEWELQDLMKIKGNPVMRSIQRHMRALPQYHVGHLSRVSEIDRRSERWRCLQIIGSGIRGVGVPSCIRGGREAAKKIVEELKSRQRNLVSVN
jgi:oxygen-dependent protoporphyrinogen oxidase